MIPHVLTIAGSDSSGGAGIQADIKTFQELHVYGMSIITAITAQNTMGVQYVYPLPKEAINEQLNAIFKDIRLHAIKIGMLYSAEIVELVARKLVEFVDSVPIVLDPVRIAKGGQELLSRDALRSLCDQLAPLTTVFTPNIPEAEEILNRRIETREAMLDAGKELLLCGAKSILLKGGHFEEENTVIDLFIEKNQMKWLENRRIKTNHTHGTGCTLASAITAELAKGTEVTEAVEKANRMIHSAIKNSFSIGHGHGPVNHWSLRD